MFASGKSKHKVDGRKLVILRPCIKIFRQKYDVRWRDDNEYKSGVAWEVEIREI